MSDIPGTSDILLNKITQFLPKIISGVIIFIIALYVSKWLSKLVERTLTHQQKDKEITILLGQITRWGILIMGSVLALEQISDKITGLLAGLGVAGFAVGFALQDVAKNFTAGLLILLQQPFNIGDAIEVAGYSGSVTAITLRSTEILTWDGRNVLIPNADVFTSPIVNSSQTSHRRITLTLGVGYSSDLEQVARVALEALKKDVPGILAEPAPMIGFKDFGDSAIALDAYYWVDTTKTGLLAAKDFGIKAIHMAFQQENIEIPFPIRTVQMVAP